MYAVISGRFPPQIGSQVLYNRNLNFSAYDGYFNVWQKPWNQTKSHVHAHLKGRG